MGVGEVSFLEDYGEKLAALKTIMKQVTGKDDYEYDEPAAKSVAVFQVDALEVIGKIR
jgi:hypothetical protein